MSTESLPFTQKRTDFYVRGSDFRKAPRNIEKRFQLANDKIKQYATYNIPAYASARIIGGDSVKTPGLVSCQ